MYTKLCSKFLYRLCSKIMQYFVGKKLYYYTNFFVRFVKFLAFIGKVSGSLFWHFSKQNVSFYYVIFISIYEDYILQNEHIILMTYWFLDVTFSIFLNIVIYSELFLLTLWVINIYLLNLYNKNYSSISSFSLRT